MHGAARPVGARRSGNGASAPPTTGGDAAQPAAAGSSLWRLPRLAVLAVLIVEAAAVASVVVGTPSLPTVGQTGLMVLLTVLSVVHTEIATGIERIRRRVCVASYFDLSSVWTFAAALLLPPLPAAAVIVAVYAHLWFRVWRPARVPIYRHLFTTATVVLAAVAAHAVSQRFGGLPHDAADVVGVVGLAVAVLVYALVNTALVACAIALSTGGTSRRLLGRWDDNALELATLCMGALAAVALVSSPGLVLLALPPILVLHRAVLVRHLEEAASTDSKTGLLNAATWQAQARRAVQRSQQGSRPSSRLRAGGDTAVLILDLDHFKLVNDRYGHLAGDAVLAAVADELRGGVRQDDLVGRFGGEEFVALLPGLGSGPGRDSARRELVEVAERLRRRVAALTVPVDTPDGPVVVADLTISVGAALSSTAAADQPMSVEELLKVADAALYSAKAGGRNLVRVGGAEPTVPGPRPAMDEQREAQSTGRSVRDAGHDAAR